MQEGLLLVAGIPYTLVLNKSGKSYPTFLICFARVIIGRIIFVIQPIISGSAYL